MKLLVVFLIMNHQCMVMNHLKLLCENPQIQNHILGTGCATMGQELEHIMFFITINHNTEINTLITGCRY
jgi:hypothetical protein